eukprot:TRINITY_DN20010_c0_g1_i1.p1 TRINITY_DN20010_c0_g1~~TRINITY_DN20010_c0_g1_i1.p1  ORF type:complete len:200 (-),score=40.14 TRINITY_DN20010_c0_g1_i1:45-644(-)
MDLFPSFAENLNKFVGLVQIMKDAISESKNIHELKDLASTLTQFVKANPFLNKITPVQFEDGPLDTDSESSQLDAMRTKLNHLVKQIETTFKDWASQSPSFIRQLNKISFDDVGWLLLDLAAPSVLIRIASYILHAAGFGPLGPIKMTLAAKLMARLGPIRGYSLYSKLQRIRMKGIPSSTTFRKDEQECQCKCVRSKL